MDLGLKGKTALVTGAGSGIGRAVALAFAAEGANVALTDLEQEGMDETLRLMDREGSGRGIAVIADAGKLDYLASLHPMGRLGRPEEVADLFVFLCSPRASLMTGGYYPADGGYLAK